MSSLFIKKKKRRPGGELKKEENANHMGGSRKTESIINLLQTTSQLDALEIYVPALEVRDGDDSRVSLKCLSALGESFNSLKHLRLMGVGFGLEIGPSWLHYSFKALRVLTLDYKSLYTFPEAGLPESLEVLCLPFYSLSSTTSSEALATDFGEDRLIHNIIARGFQPSLTSLKEIVVPSRPIAGGGEEVIVPKRVKSWALGRSALAKAKEFESGKVKLRTVGRGEVAGDALKGEVFWSTLRWLSPP